MALTSKQKALIEAFLGSARRNPHVAAVMAGMSPITKSAANALLEHAEIRREIERLNTNAIIVDGKLIDVEPGSLDPVVARQKRGTRPLKATTGHMAVLDAIVGKKPTLEVGTILTEDGVVAGTAEEHASRLAAVITGSKHLYAVKGSSPALVAHLEAGFERRQQEMVARATPEGGLAIVTKVKTRYELKLWLSMVMDGRVPDPQEPGKYLPVNDIHVQMQAAGLLGKALGAFSEKVIDEEHRRESHSVSDETEMLKQQIVETEAKLERMKSGS